MNFEQIFAAYYTQYRGESEVPASTDDEFTIALRLANEAIDRWEHYDVTYWDELWTTLSRAEDGDSTISSAITYTAPENLREAGGTLRVLDTDGSIIISYPIVQVQEIQFMDQNAQYAYFTVANQEGEAPTMTLSFVPSATITGKTWDYDYYKQATKFTTGNSRTEMKRPYFIVHHMLANRFRVSRNWSAYQTAKRDAEDILRTAQADQNSGSWTNPWKLPDRSGSSWGA